MKGQEERVKKIAQWMLDKHYGRMGKVVDVDTPIFRWLELLEAIKLGMNEMKQYNKPRQTAEKKILAFIEAAQSGDVHCAYCDKRRGDIELHLISGFTLLKLRLRSIIAKRYPRRKKKK